MRKLHFYSGLTLAIFIGFHLLNHLMSLAGPDSHIQFMDTLRVVYRHPIIEGLLLLAVAIQIFSGLQMYWPLRKAKFDFWYTLKIRTGLYMAFFFLLHVAAVLGGRSLMQLDTNLYFGAAGLNDFPLLLFFVPYYGLAIFSFFGHIAALHCQRMRIVIFGLNATQQARIILGLGGLMVLVLMYGLTGGFQGLEIPKEYGVMVGE
ncbi:MAG: hypothetical protein AAGA10_08460 [Bacteroidota bacterium]